MKTLPRIIILIFAAILIYSCNDSNNNPINNKTAEIDVKIAVFSDPHYFDPDLGSPGEAFETARINSRKMIAESEEIINSAVDYILASDVQIVLIPGDLTKDGEKSSHEKFAEILKRLTNAGKKVFVIPGNHDISNPEANSYIGADKISTQNISPEEFRQIYHDFAYSEAIYKDENSLAYISEPIPDLWIIGMDACRYSENTDKHVVGGRFNQESLNWLKEKLIEGRSKGKLMLGMLHHGLLEHFDSQKSNPVSSEFVLDDYAAISQLFAESGMNFVFTGHFHANDIVKAEYDNTFIYDIETGSLLTYPVPLRYINIIGSKTMEITSKHLQDVNINTKGKTFQEYAEDYLTSDLDLFIVDILNSRFNIDTTIAKELAPVGVGAFTAHYKGDEIITENALNTIKKYESSDNLAVNLFIYSVESLYTDLNPQDNSIKIDMRTGTEIK